MTAMGASTCTDIERGRLERRSFRDLATGGFDDALSAE
jgi:hypothetical protein